MKRFFQKLFWWRRSNDLEIVESKQIKTVESSWDPKEFNRKFVAANVALTKGNSDGLREGIGLFIEGLAFAGRYKAELRYAIQELYAGLSKHDRADTKGPWNWDLSGYGLFSWKNDLYSRDEALRNAWSYIKSINDSLKALGLGWNY